MWLMEVENFRLTASQIQLHEPAMLIVGTKGKSLQGVQGLLGGRTSFSKWALQYSPIPVVVVRSAAQRGKKKIKRDRDPQRGDYIRMLRESGLEVHECETNVQNNMFEAPNTPDVEAYAVISALGLPENFIPKFKPLSTLEGDALKRDIALRALTDRPSEVTLIGDSTQNSPNMAAVDSLDTDSGTDSETDDSGDEFETIDGRVLLQNSSSEEERKQKLQKMKLEEAKAFAARAPKNVNGDVGTERKTSVESVDSAAGGKRSSEDDDDEEDENGQRVKGSRKSSVASSASTSSDYSAVLDQRRESNRSDVEEDHEIDEDDLLPLGDILEKIDSNFSVLSEHGGVSIHDNGGGGSGTHGVESSDDAISPFGEGVKLEGKQKKLVKENSDEAAISPHTVVEDPLEDVSNATPQKDAERKDGKEEK